jgi:hypothetical protein
MLPEIPKLPNPLDYAGPAGLSPCPKPLMEVAGFHYVAGIGASTLVSAFVLLSLRGHDYPLTLACGGIFVVVIQWVLVALPAFCRRLLFQHLLVERSTSTTIIGGLVGGALVFGMPFLFAKVTTAPVASACATLIPLCVYPLAISFIVFRQVRPAEPNAV